MKVLTIGRSKENNDIVVNDKKVSRNHLQLILGDNGNYLVVDLNSTNGTFVNGNRIIGQASLQSTDELRIGDTILPWQSYFANQSNGGLNYSLQSQSSKSETPYVQQPASDPKSPKGWLMYVIIAVIVVVLVGGVIGWNVYHNKEQQAELKEQLNNSKINVEKAKAEYSEAEAEYQKALAEAERLEKIAAQTQTKEALDSAIAAKKEVKAKKEHLARVNGSLDSLKTILNTIKSSNKKQADSLKNMIKDRDTLLTSAQQQIMTVKSKNQELEKTNQMYEILNGWDEKKASEFCKKQNWSATKDCAKNIIVVQFKSLENTAKGKIIEEMKKFKFTEKEESKQIESTDSQAASTETKSKNKK